jgi:GGDEF domain-containing protein
VSESVILTDSDDASIQDAAALLDSWTVVVRPARELATALGETANVRVVVTTTENPNALRDVVDRARALAMPVVVGCPSETARRRAIELRVDEWFLLPASAEEIAARIRSALAGMAPAAAALADRIERVEYEQMLYDYLTGLPTLPVMIERSRALIKERGELIVLYFNFVRYSKIEEIYGWEKLDAVLETTAQAVREFLDSSALRSSRVMVSFTNDDDFVFFHVPAPGVAAVTDAEITELVPKLQEHVGGRIEATHGEEIASLFEIYVGRAHVYYNPKIRFQRLIYRGIREAANAAKSVEERERARRVDDLKRSLRERAVYIDLHPILVADTRRVYGYEARCARSAAPRSCSTSPPRPTSSGSSGASAAARPSSRCKRA